MDTSPHDQPLPVALCVQGRRVLLIGGGDEATDKCAKLCASGARVTLVAEQATPELAARARAGQIVWWVRALNDGDLRAVDVVLLSDIDAPLAAHLRREKSKYGYLFAAIDQPAVSDFFFMSVVTRGPVQIAVSTGGRAPLLARALRKALEAALGDDFTRFAERMATLRHALRALPKPERVPLLSQAFAGFAMDVRVRYPEDPPGSAEERGPQRSSTGIVCER